MFSIFVYHIIISLSNSDEFIFLLVEDEFCENNNLIVMII